MDERIENLIFVVLSSPYDTWSNPQTEPLFSALVGLKLRGYGAEYPYGVLPVDTTDFVADHLIICDSSSGLLRPVLSIKSVSLAKCEMHRLPFPGLTLVQQAQAERHIMRMEWIIHEAERSSTDLRYVGSWTIDPAHRKDPAWSKMLRDLFTALYVSYHLETKSQIIAGGTLRFKIDEYVKWLGHEPFKSSVGNLSPIGARHLADERVLVTHLREFSSEAKAMAKKWKHLWENRLVISASGDKGQVSRAA